MTKNNKILKTIALCACAASLSFGFVACTSGSGDTAAKRLAEARILFAAEKYNEAKQAIDSLNILFPKSFDERKAGVVLLDSVRRASDVLTIANCDSALAEVEPVIEKLKKDFAYDINKMYQATGTYVPKKPDQKGAITTNMLRSGVTAEGSLYIESVFVGAQRHNQISIAVAGGQTVESQVVIDDGVNYSFKNLGKQFEVLRFAGDAQNGLAKMVTDNADKKLTLTLIGKSSNSYVLSKQLKDGIAQSYELSTKMLYADSLRNAKQESEFKIRYLDNRDEISKVNKELEDNNESMRNVTDKN